MGNLRKRSVSAYLLLESLISMALLALLATVVLTEVVRERQQLAQENQRLEALNVAQMAVESHLTELSANGAVVTIEETTRHFVVLDHGKEILQLELKN